MWGWEEKTPLFSLRNSDIPEDSGRHLDNLFLGDAVSLKQRNMYCTVQYTNSCPFLCKSQDLLLLMLVPGISPPSLSFFVKPIWERGPIRVEGAWKENSLHREERVLFFTSKNMRWEFLGVIVPVILLFCKYIQYM